MKQCHSTEKTAYQSYEIPDQFDEFYFMQLFFSVFFFEFIFAKRYFIFFTIQIQISKKLT